MSRLVEIATHYDLITEQTLQQRSERLTIHVDNFNNLLKGRIIEDFRPQDDHVTRILDLASGKSGDFQKFTKSFPFLQKYIGLDVSAHSVTEANKRINKQIKSKDATQTKQFVEMKAYAADVCDQNTWPRHILSEKCFDMVNMQFGIHYAYEQQERFIQFLNNVSSSLRVGGTFIGTFVEAAKSISSSVSCIYDSTMRSSCLQS